MDAKDKVVLAVGGSDPSGGAGVQADQTTLLDHKVPAIFAITAVTAQNDEEILSIHPTPADVLTQQLSTACKGKCVAAVKIGMVYTKANVQALSWFLKSLNSENVVIDPVLHSSSGAALLESDALAFFRQRLLPLATVITPNLSEASILAGMQVATLETMRTAAEVIHREAMRHGATRKLSVAVKGGHLDGDALDVIFDGKDFHVLSAKRVPGRSPRGTGCRFASAMAANLALGLDALDAAAKAKEYMSRYIEKKSLGSIISINRS